jgi:hypothetical protein
MRGRRSSIRSPLLGTKSLARRSLMAIWQADADQAVRLRRALGSCCGGLALTRRRRVRIDLEELRNLIADTAENCRDGEARNDRECNHAGCSDLDPSPHRHSPDLIGAVGRLLNPEFVRSQRRCVPRSFVTDDAEAVDSRSDAFGAAVVPLHEDLELIGVEDGAPHADAHARLHELDPIAFRRNQPRFLRLMIRPLPHDM